MLILSVLFALLCCANYGTCEQKVVATTTPVTTTPIDPPPSAICIPPAAGYDINILSVAPYWRIDIDEGCEIEPGSDDKCSLFVAFCKPFASLVGCNGASACIKYPNKPHYSIVVGNYAPDPFSSYLKDGFEAEFPVGDIINNTVTNKNCPVSVVIIFDCDANSPWNLPDPHKAGIAPAPSSFASVSSTSCQITVNIPYAGACKKTDTTTALATSTATTPIDPPPSVLCIPPKKEFDISILSIAPFWRIDIDTGCQIEPGSDDRCSLFLAFCKPFESLAGCNGASACIKYPNKPHFSVVVGNYSADPFESYENRFDAEFPAGEIINNTATYKNCAVSVLVIFDCDPAQPWDLPDPTQAGIGPAPTSFSSVSATSCQLIVRIPYAGACIKKPENPGLSGGTIFVIIALSLVFAYLVVFSSYNKFVAKKTGAEIIPNYDLWVKFLMASLEGFIYAWRFVTCQKAKTGKLLYDQV